MDVGASSTIYGTGRSMGSVFGSSTTATRGTSPGWVGPTHPDYVPELTDEIEIAWSLRREFWGKGIATEGAEAAVATALEHLSPARLISLIDPDNLRSVAVAKRLGMRDLGSVDHGELDLQLRLHARKFVTPRELGGDMRPGSPALPGRAEDPFGPVPPD
jgi:RimJ/RimL family protein N-acetyltransferase